MSNLPEAASSAKTHGCHTTRSWAIRHSPVESRQENLYSRTAAHRKVMLLSFFPPSRPIYFLIPTSLPILLHRPTDDHLFVFIFVFLQSEYCFVLSIYIITLRYPLLFHSTSFSQSTHFKIHPVTVYVCHLEPLNHQFSQRWMPPHRALQQTSGDL